MYGRRSFAENGAHLLYTRGQARVYGNRFFHHPWFIRDVVCADGRRRTAYANNDGTEFRVQIKRIWYYGPVQSVEINDNDDLYFNGTSTFQKIVHGYVVRYWMEEHKDQNERVEISVLAILNAVTRQTGIGLLGSSVILSVNGHVKDTAKAPLWLQYVRMRMISHPDSTWGDLVAIMKDAGVR